MAGDDGTKGTGGGEGIGGARLVAHLFSLRYDHRQLWHANEVGQHGSELVGRLHWQVERREGHEVE